MKVVLLSLAALCLVAVSRADDDPTTSLPGVIDLTPENFDQHVNGAKHALVEFYAPWCGHCKRMTGEFKKLGEIITADAKLKSRIVVGKVNADTHRSLGQKFGVGGYPTLKYFARGTPADKDSAVPYEGARTSDKFLEFLTAKLEADKGFARVDALDSLATKFAAAAKGGQAAVIAETEAAVKKLEDKAKENGELYVKLMKKAVEKGVEWFAKEQARLERMIGSGSVAAGKLEEMQRKASVLGAFVAKEEDKDAAKDEDY